MTEAQEKRIVTINVYPHVRKYMMAHYIRNSQGVFICTESTPLGLYTRLALLDREEWRNPSNDQVRDRATASVQLELTTSQLRLSPRLFKLKSINIYLDRQFKEALISCILSQNEAGVAVYPACKIFLEQYHIDEKDYSLDNCYKHWQRWKSKIPLNEQSV